MAIGMMVLIIVSYATGVEKGKRSSMTDLKKIPGETALVAEGEGVTDSLFQPDDAVEYPENLGEKEPDTGKAEDEEEETEVREKEEEESKIRKKASTDVDARYDIQLASFKKETLARLEVTKLKRKGFDAALAKSGRWYQVYATGYKTIDEAKKAREELAGDYKDCYIRRVE